MTQFILQSHSAQIFINFASFPLTNLTASYDAKVICNTTFGSPGPDGVVFSKNVLVGANSNSISNYSHQNVTLLSTGVNSIKIKGLSGLGWGFVGVSINSGSLGIDPIVKNDLFSVYPNQNKLSLISDINLIGSCYKVFDHVGRLILSGTINSPSIEIQLENLASGLYLLNIGNVQNQTYRIVKE